MNSKVITIVGMGPGISQAAAERFGREGFAVGMIARNVDRLQLLQELLEKQRIVSSYYAADAADLEGLQRAFINIHGELGPTGVLLYNAAKVKKVNILEESANSLAADFRVNVGGALEAVKAVLPEMEAQGAGSILFTGGGLSLRPNPDYGSLSIGKAGLRSLALQLHSLLKEKNIKVGTVTVTGFVSVESEKHTPSAVAGKFWEMHQTPLDKFQPEIVF